MSSSHCFGDQNCNVMVIRNFVGYVSPWTLFCCAVDSSGNVCRRHFLNFLLEMVKEIQNEDKKNKFLPYAAALDEESSQSLREIKTYLGSAILLREVREPLLYWIFRLDRWVISLIVIKKLPLRISQPLTYSNWTDEKFRKFYNYP